MRGGRALGGWGLTGSTRDLVHVRADPAGGHDWIDPAGLDEATGQTPESGRGGGEGKCEGDGGQHRRGGSMVHDCLFF